MRCDLLVGGSDFLITRAMSERRSLPSTVSRETHLLLHDTQPKADNVTNLPPLLSCHTAEDVEEYRQHLSSHPLEMRDTLGGILLINTEVVQQLFLSRS
jgi:hypothetical protein